MNPERLVGLALAFAAGGLTVLFFIDKYLP